MPIRIFSCSANLPVLLAEELAKQTTRDFSGLAVVVPSRRLGNYVRRALAERVTACIPPKILTLDEFAGMIPLVDRRQRLSKTEQVLLLADLLTAGRYQHFRRGMEDDLSRFFDELVAEELLPEAFSRIRELLRCDEFKDERHLERLLRQADELESLHKAYAKFLAQNKLIDAAGDLAARAESAIDSSFFASSAPAPLQLSLFETEQKELGHPKIYLLGFVDATRVQKKLLARLLKEKSVHFWTHAEPSFLSEQSPSSPDWFRRVNPFSPLIELLQSLGEESTRNLKDEASRSTTNDQIIKAAYRLPAHGNDVPSMPKETAIHLHEAATPLAEVKAAGALIRKLVHHQNIPPHQIVVVVPDEQIYGRLVWSVFAEAGIQANNSLGQPLLSARVGQWLHLLLTLVQEKWRLPDLISFLHHPFSEMWMRALSPQSAPADLQAFVEHCLINGEIASGQARILAAIRAEDHGDQKTLKDAEYFLTKLASSLAPFANDDELVLTEWAERFVHLLHEIQLERWTVMTGGGAYNLDGQALQLLGSFLQEMQRIGQFLQAPFRFADFFRLLNQQVFAAMVRPVGEPHSDVQVMGLLESRSVPARVFVVLGNNEGSFPTTLGREVFLEEPLRARLGLTTYHKRELLQDMNFYALAAGAQEIHLFYSRLHDDAPRVRSRFIERLFLLNALAPGVVHVHQENGWLFESDYVLDEAAIATHESLRQRRASAQSRMESRCDQRGDFHGDRSAWLSTYSATTLRMLFHCPYRFLLNAARINQLELPVDEADSRLLGDWLHSVFQLFFQGITDPSIPVNDENADLREPWTKAISPQNKEVAFNRLQRLGRLLMTPHEGQEHLFYHMLYIGWPAFIEKEIARGAGVFRPEYFEFKIEDQLREAVPVGPHQVRVRGRVDRIFAKENEIRLIDYKLSGFRGSGISILEADEPQLPLYALALQKTGVLSPSAKWIGEYWSIRHGESKTVLEKEDNGLAAGFENLLNRWQSRLNQLSSGAPFDAEETKYCDECLYAGVCRREELFYRERNKKSKQ